MDKDSKQEHGAGPGDVSAAVESLTGIEQDLFPLTVALGAVPFTTGSFTKIELKPGSDDPLNWSGQNVVSEDNSKDEDVYLVRGEYIP